MLRMSNGYRETKISQIVHSIHNKQAHDNETGIFNFTNKMAVFSSGLNLTDEWYKGSYFWCQVIWVNLMQQWEGK